MEKQKEQILCYVGSSTSDVLVKQYAQEKYKKLVCAENFYDFLNKSSSPEFKEIIFDYLFVNRAVQKDESFEALQKASTRGVTLKLLCETDLEKKDMRKMYRSQIREILPSIKEKLFD